ncbi:MAG: hypothetical protein M3Y59_20970 [Myxococcota bacterium]|nr:hypothetical protein [Myxococcota bacterium]
MAGESKQVARDSLNEAPRRRWLWPALAIWLVSVGLATGAAALAQSSPPSRIESINPENKGHYARLLSEVKRDEEAARREIALAAEAASDEALAAGLISVANGHRLAGESTRQAYLKAADRLESSAKRARVLRKLLEAAPITVETGAEVLRQAVRSGTGAALLKVLMSMHEIKESDLVRWPLAGQYLAAAEKLTAPEDLSEALRGQLHPRALESPQVVRALRLAERLDSDEDRLKVLREVTDHQVLTPEVMAGYRKGVERMRTASARSTAGERLESAKEEQGGLAHQHSVNGPQGFVFQVDADERSALKVQLEQVKQKMRQLRERMARDLGEDINLERFEIQID